MVRAHLKQMIEFAFEPTKQQFVCVDWIFTAHAFICVYRGKFGLCVWIGFLPHTLLFVYTGKNWAVQLAQPQGFLCLLLMRPSLGMMITRDLWGN